MLLGYARVSTDGQDHALQLDALRAAGCERIFIETASGSGQIDRNLPSCLFRPDQKIRFAFGVSIALLAVFGISSTSPMI